MNKPRPVPWKDFEANFENSCGNICGSIPSPVSFTVTIAWVSFFSVETDIAPSLVNLTALVSRFAITWYILALSASTNIASFDSVNNIFNLVESEICFSTSFITFNIFLLKGNTLFYYKENTHDKSFQLYLWYTTVWFLVLRFSTHRRNDDEDCSYSNIYNIDVDDTMYIISIVSRDLMLFIFLPDLL